MGASPNIADVLKNAHKVMESGNKFTGSVDKQAGVKSSAAPALSYTQARAARKSPDEFMGIKSDQAPELNSALESRANAKKALEQ